MLARIHFYLALLFLTLLFCVDPAAGQSAVPDSGPTIGPAKPGLFDRVIANQKKDDEALDVYERMERLETRKSGSSLEPVSVKIARVIPNGTGIDKIAVGPDGHPANVAEYRAALEKLEKALALIVEGHSQREAMEKYAKRRKDRVDLIEATHSAFFFTFVANEFRGERMLAKYKMEPNPAFRPTTRLSTIFTKVHGFVWIDEAAGELGRVEGDVTEDISIGLILGKIYKGSHFMQERYEFAPGLWLASFAQYDFDGRKFFSSFSIHEKTFYSNYRYIGPPREALAAIRSELGRGDLGKPAATTADH